MAFSHTLHVGTFVFFVLFSFASSLNSFVGYYEKLDYEPVLQRDRRSIADNNQSLQFRFRFRDHDFHLLLHPIAMETSVFHRSHFIEVDDNFVKFEPRHFLYRGHLQGDVDSHVYGSVLDGLFDGHIYLRNGTTFTVEKVAKYFRMDKRPTSFHSIVYNDETINYQKIRRKRQENNTSERGNCGLDEKMRIKMEKWQKYRTESEANIVDDNDDDDFGSIFGHFMKNRHKRQSFVYDEINRKRMYKVRTCSMYLQADQKLYEQVYLKEGNRNRIRTREEIMALFYNHIKAVNHIYESSNFGGVTGLNFVIQRTSIFTPATCHNGRALVNSTNPFCQENVDVSNFLNINSQRNHSSFCLAYALTYRDFVGGTLGLAWVASPNTNTAGGICQVYQRYNEGSQGWVYRSLNTGIITMVNYGNRVPTRVSQLTLAHEIGHNFGSPHDYPSECQPGLPDGNFIMFASATSGDKANNANFSPCSINNISSVLHEVLKQPPVDPQKVHRVGHGKRNCFQERTSAFCGNQIYEPDGDEQCDCGFTEKDCKQMDDHCCWPHENNGEKGCKLKRGTICSPSQGQCCQSSSCSYYRLSSRHKCRDESDCQLEQFCNGHQAKCPLSIPKRDDLPCQDVTKVCQGGSCNGSICEVFGLKDCFLTEGSPENLCNLACQKDGKCISTVYLDIFSKPMIFGKLVVQKNRESEKGLLLRPGSPCNNYQGYCDIFRKCRSVDSNGPLARLKKLLFNRETIETVSDWIQEHWWAVVLMGIGISLLMAMFVKCCAVHTPSTNPNKAPAHSIYETLRRPQTLMHRPHHHPSGHVLSNEAANLAHSHNDPHRHDRRRRRHRRRSRHGNRSLSSANEHSRPMSSAVDPMSSSSANGVTPHASVIVVEPPPPYSVDDSGVIFGGGENMPKRGHRKNKDRKNHGDIELTAPKGRR